MTFEEQQKKYKEEYDELLPVVQRMRDYFTSHPNEKRKRFGVQEEYIQRYQLEKVLESYGVYSHYDYSIEYMQFLALSYKLSDLQTKLKETPTSRNIKKAANFMASITPQHVSGRVYKVENGDGCGTFCLWFIIIDAIICFIVWLIIG